MPPYSNARPLKTVLRARLWYVLVMIVFGIILVRAFYLQIIRHEYYKQTANVGHLKEYEIQAQRGVIKAHDGSAVVPIVLDQTMYTVYADPTMIKDASKVAETLSSILKGDTSEYEAKLKSEDTRYVVLARKVSKQDKEALLKKKYPGLGAQEQQVRTYPNGSLAAQVLGFVNNEGKGVYGIEQELNGKLAGTNGQLKAVTDVHGVPLAANTDNILKNAVPGSDVVLTIDVAMQRQLEQLLKSGLERAKSDQGSALIMDVKNGDIKAMANWPTYDPTNYGDVEDANVFNNASVSHPIEVGSVMKPLTMAAALNENAVQPNTTYYDPAKFEIDDFTITNIEEDGGPGTKSMADLLNLSLNTGATWLLMRMSGNNDHITKAGRDKWHDYMTNHFMFGKPTGIEQGQDAEGSVPDPDKGYARDLTYANTSFGQAMTATPLQMAAAYTAVLNGGTYYKPRLVDSYISPDGKKTTLKPEVVKQNVVSPKVSQELQPLLEFVVDKHSFKRKFDQSTYSVGGKTGTAQIADHENGGYLADEFNGTYVGFVGGDEPQYVIAVSVIKPKIKGYAGSQAAQPLFGDLAHMLIDKFNVTPKIK